MSLLGVLNPLPSDTTQTPPSHEVIYATASADAYMFYRCFFVFLFFFPSVTKIPDNHSPERLNGFLRNFYQTIAGKCSFQRRTKMGARPPINFLGLKTTHCAVGGDAWRVSQN